MDSGDVNAKRWQNKINKQDRYQNNCRSVISLDSLMVLSICQYWCVSIDRGSSPAFVKLFICMFSFHSSLHFIVCLCYNVLWCINMSMWTGATVERGEGRGDSWGGEMTAFFISFHLSFFLYPYKKLNPTFSLSPLKVSPLLVAIWHWFLSEVFPLRLILMHKVVEGLVLAIPPAEYLTPNKPGGLMKPGQELKSC